MTLNMYLLIIPLNVNVLNAPTQGHTVAEWIRKQDPYICSLQETHLRSKDTHRLKVKDGKRYFMQMEMIQKAGVAILITNKIDFKAKVIVRDKERHYIMIKATIQQEDITLVSIYTPNIGACKYVKERSTAIQSLLGF